MPWLVRGNDVLASLEVAGSFRARLVGLLGRDELDGALLLRGARAVHTLGMRFPVDVAYCDGELTVLRTATLARHRLDRPVWRARSVIEAQAGAFERWNLRVGDELEIRGLDGPAGRSVDGEGLLSRHGALVLVATPIGNLGDLSPRAVEALAGADAIACEDTRRTGRLLAHAGVTASKLLTVNDHTEAARVGDVLARLDRGERVAVVSDAGTPGISDPGERLVRAAIAAGHVVEIVPGPSAVVAALVVSGLPTGRFVFEGFLPRKGSGRAERLAVLSEEARTIVLYEAPHRVQRTLVDLSEAFGGARRVAVGRELTKLHEEVWRGTLADAVGWAAANPPRGEMALVVDGAPLPGPAAEDELADALQAELASGSPVKEAAAVVARRFGVPRRETYSLALRLREGPR